MEVELAAHRLAERGHRRYRGLLLGSIDLRVREDGHRTMFGRPAARRHDVRPRDGASAARTVVGELRKRVGHLRPNDVFATERTTLAAHRGVHGDERRTKPDSRGLDGRYRLRVTTRD